MTVDTVRSCFAILYHGSKLYRSFAQQISKAKGVRYTIKLYDGKSAETDCVHVVGCSTEGQARS